jgi:hypothetical protein
VIPGPDLPFKCLFVVQLAQLSPSFKYYLSLSNYFLKEEEEEEELTLQSTSSTVRCHG